jgi:hypothetical protein
MEVSMISLPRFEHRCLRPAQRAAAALVVLARLGAGCVWKTDLPSTVTDIPVRPERELLVTDEALLSGPLAQNAASAPLSFRHAMETLPLADGAVLDWLRAWSQRLTDEGHADRAQTFDQGVTCRWLKATPANACDEACAACAGSALAMEAAPFRLIAVSNRTDLAVMPDRAADGGEGRLVYALTAGPGDDPESPSLAATVIVEYAQDGTALEWTTRWHALGSASDADYPSKLVELTETFVGRGSLAQLRTADAWTGPMILNQYDLEAGELVATRARDTLDFGVVSAAMIDAFDQSNGGAIQNGTAVFPSAWWAMASSPSDSAPAFVARLADHDALVQETCGGCHALSANGFQIDPLAQGSAKVSRFLVDPSKDGDELRRRVEWMQLELSGHGI